MFFDSYKHLGDSAKAGRPRRRAMPVASRWRCCNAPSVGGTRGMPCHAPVEYPRLAKTLGFWAFRELLPQLLEHAIFPGAAGVIDTACDSEYNAFQIRAPIDWRKVSMQKRCRWEMQAPDRDLQED